MPAPPRRPTRPGGHPPPDDRDRLVSKDRPSGEWPADEVTGADSDTPVGAESLERMSRRVKQTNITTTATLTGLDSLRRETRVDIDRIEEHVGRIDEKVDRLGEHVGDLRETTGSMASKLDMLVDGVDRERKESAERQRITFEAHVDVDSKKKILLLKDAADARRSKRDLWFKILKGFIGIVLAAAAGAITLLFEHRC